MLPASYCRKCGGLGEIGRFARLGQWNMRGCPRCHLYWDVRAPALAGSGEHRATTERKE